MLGGMTADGHRGAPGARCGLLAAEVSAFTLLAIVDAVLGLRNGFTWSGIPHSAGVAAAVVAVLRRRLTPPATDAGEAEPPAPRAGKVAPPTPGSVTSPTVGTGRAAPPANGAGAVAPPGRGSGAGGLRTGGTRAPDLPALGVGTLALAAIAALPGASTLAVLSSAVIVGAGCRRLEPLIAAGLALGGGAVMVEAGRARTWAAVAAAVIWGVSVAVGLMLRDADARRQASAVAARTAERLRIARELHDVVAHHVTGIVVRAQAAGVVAGKRDPAAMAGYGEIEDAAKEALTAMRRLVRTLRSDEVVAERTDDLERSLRIAAGDDPRVRITVEGVGSLPPRVVATAYWLTLEALTNVRKHAPGAAEIVVDARTENAAFDAALRIAIVNDAVAAPPPGEGFGLVGMAERVRDAGGTLRTGPTGDGRWEVEARLPLNGPVERGV
jgi:signal transduction histidine kinase